MWVGIEDTIKSGIPIVQEHPYPHAQAVRVYESDFVSNRNHARAPQTHHTHSCSQSCLFYGCILRLSKWFYALLLEHGQQNLDPQVLTKL